MRKASKQTKLRQKLLDLKEKAERYRALSCQYQEISERHQKTAATQRDQLNNAHQTSITLGRKVESLEREVKCAKEETQKYKEAQIIFSGKLEGYTQAISDLGKICVGVVKGKMEGNEFE